MSNNIYNILGKLNALTPQEPAETAAKEPVYESIDARGSIMEAVAAAIGRKKYGKAKFQKAAAAGKKLGEAAKPDYIDLDKDGDKTEPMKKAAKDAKKVEESGGPYELYNPKHPKFAANYKKFKAKNPDAKLQDFIDAMKKKEHGVNEGEYDPAPIDPEAVAKRKRLQALKDRAEDEGDIFAKEKNTPIRKVAGKAYGGAAQHDAPEADDLDEVAPPGAKAERMVKHIKKGYAKDGKLTKREKGIAYATAWKAHNRGQVEEGVEFKDTIANSKAELKKAKPAKLKESRVMEETDYFYEKVGKALAEKNPTLDTAGSEFVDAVRKEMVAQGIPPNRARNILLMDEDFIMDVATSYGHYCKEIAECSAPVNSFVAGTDELDEIARLAGLSTAEEELDEREQFQSMPQGYASSTPAAPAVDPTKKSTFDKSKLNPMREEEMEEGNEFSGALAAAKASGKKEFEVDGKKYTVKEAQEKLDEMINATVNFTADDLDAVTLMKLLSGIDYRQDEPAQPVQDQAPLEAPQPTDNTVPQAGLEEERDVEYTNTPREETAGVDAAIPSGTDLNRGKKQYRKEYPGDNPMAVEESLWTAYESMVNDVKK